MKKLYELASFCNNHKEIVVALLPSNSVDPIRQLCNLLFTEKDLSNQEAMVRIYGAMDSKSFSIIKTKMYEVLIKAISVQSISSGEEKTRYNSLISSMRENLAARVVMYRGSTSLAMSIIEKSILTSTEDKSSLNELERLRMLTLHYGTSNFNKYKLKKFLELEKDIFELLNAEKKAIHYFIELKKLQMHSFAEISDIEKLKAKQYSKELLSINVRSRVFDFYKFQVFVKNYEFNHEFGKLLSLCEDAESAFSSDRNYSLSSLIVIKQVKLWTLIQLGRFVECVEIGLPELDKKDLSATNWYTFLHYIIKGFLYSGSYNEARIKIAYCFNHFNFKKLNEDLKEIANLHLGYIHLILESNRWEETNQTSELPIFKLGKFINTTHIFNKDKRGINVSILLMHIAFLLQRKDYNAIIDRTDSLNQYAYRYLRKDDSFRSNCMIKMVIQMTKADFNPIRTDRYTADLRKQLGSVSLAGSGENIEVEIIPFEILWDIMRKTL